MPKFVIEHMESEFSEWVQLEYLQICLDVGKENLYLSSIPSDVKALPTRLEEAGIQWTHEDITNFAESIDVKFDPKRVCLLDPKATEEFCPGDAELFDYFLFGGILGDDPPRDRTGELRKYGFPGRHLGPVQMTTDTAVRVAQIVAQKQIPLADIKYVDHPELKFSKYESVEMPFRYVTDNASKPIMPEGMFKLIREDSNKGWV